jgi:hypothetical protein
LFFLSQSILSFEEFDRESCVNMVVAQLNKEMNGLIKLNNGSLSVVVESLQN